MKTSSLVAGALVFVFAACGDDGEAVDAMNNPTIDASANQADGPINQVDAPPNAPDASPPPPDASTVGRACSFTDTVTITLNNGVGGAMICVDPATGNNCRIIEQIRSSCFNDQAGFAFGMNENISPTQRSVVGVDSVSITAGTMGTLMGSALISIPDGQRGTATGMFPGGEEYVVDFEYNSTTLTIYGLAGPN